MHVRIEHYSSTICVMTWAQDVARTAKRKSSHAG